jgi:CheY-like chemotaxis protein/HPt (histidine-containing phosphotransfer) domain-containing protein
MRLLKGGARLNGSPDVREPEDYRLPERYGSTTVLLVEDNPVNQEVASQLLRSAGLNVDVAGDGQQAVQMVRRNAYDLVLMDVQMPRMDGLQATRLLRQDPMFAELPIIAMTANAMQEDRQACMDAGMNDHLAKPVEPRQLHLALLRWLPAQKSALPVATPSAAASGKTAETPQRSPEQKLAQLAELVDLSQAYEYCAGQAGILLGVMRKFTGHYEDAGRRLTAHLDAGQMDEASRLLHSLRGVSATVGATDILAQTKQLEQAIQEGATPEGLVSLAAPLCSALDSLVAAIAEQLAE